MLILLPCKLVLTAVKVKRISKNPSMCHGQRPGVPFEDTYPMKIVYRRVVCSVPARAVSRFWFSTRASPMRSTSADNPVDFRMPHHHLVTSLPRHSSVACQLISYMLPSYRRRTCPENIPLSVLVPRRQQILTSATAKRSSGWQTVGWRQRPTRLLWLTWTLHPLRRYLRSPS